MNVLRTPKTLPGPELGIPALGFQAWYEARNGGAAYDAFARIPREAWAEYLAWYRRFLGIAVRYRTRLARIEPSGRAFPAASGRRGRRGVETARKVILANGVAGNGGPYIPRGAERQAAALALRPYCRSRSISRRCAASGWR